MSSSALEGSLQTPHESLLHVALQLVDGALVQVAAEKGEQVGGQKKRLHQGTLG